MRQRFFYPADIMLPKKDFEKWAVVACDQYTSEPEYWEDVKNIVGDTPSALNVILPEVYLKEDNSENIEKINATMREYVKNDVFAIHKDALIYVERKVGENTRKGLVGLVDLEDYDYSKDSKTLVRATEETIKDRLPARIQIRQDAILELPHILLLFDDPSRSVVKPLENKKSEFEIAYDFDLMKNGGHITGWFLNERAVDEVQKALGNLMLSGDDVLFVVGDGNHSLAAAKEYYKQSGDENARYALVEIENVHDKSIEFEPIYRVLFNVDKDDFMNKFKKYTDEYGNERTQDFEYYTKEETGVMTVNALAELPVGTLQQFIDLYMKNNPSVKIDYIHGEEVVKSLCKKEGVLGFIFEGMTKESFFPAIRADGSLPRKTFSMGHANEKRYYIEAHRIKAD
ncbi:MAG: DUF1015 domain-containing protein [Lachnospiraceae bacterium]|nr:DUF1015 domain-containing protein [Lachnospiraceae bacterium]